MLYLLLPILAVGFLVFVFVSIKKEKDIIGFYKAQGIFGRAYAFFAVDFLFGGLADIVVGIIVAVSSEEIGSILAVIGAGVAMMSVGIFMYVRIYKKCQGELKKRVFLDLTMAGWGFAGRVEFFLLAIIFNTWFDLNKPTEYEVNGRTVYAFPGSNDLYDSSGCKVGVANDDFTKANMR